MSLSTFRPSRDARTTHHPPAGVRPSRAPRVTLAPEALTAAFTALQRQLTGTPPDSRACEAISRLVAYANEPHMATALQGRTDPEVALRDLATGYAFALVYAQEPFGNLPLFLQRLVNQTLDTLNRRAEAWERTFGEHPFDEDSNTFASLCQELAGYVPRKPLRVHIENKIRCYESAVSRALRQIEYLVQHKAVTDAFAAFVLAFECPADLREALQEVGGPLAVEVFRAQLLQWARGGARKDLRFDPVAVVRFFALPVTVAFVRGFAGTVETARSLYGEDEFAAVAWTGKRQPRRNRRTGYIEAALMQLDRQQAAHGAARGAFDGGDDQPDDDEAPRSRALVEAAAKHAERTLALAFRSRSFERWAVETALEEAPNHPLWLTAEALFVRGLTAAEIIAAGISNEAGVTAAREAVEAVRANETVWEAWASSLA